MPLWHSLSQKLATENANNWLSHLRLLLSSLTQIKKPPLLFLGGQTYSFSNQKKSTSPSGGITTVLVRIKIHKLKIYRFNFNFTKVISRPIDFKINRCFTLKLNKLDKIPVFTPG